MCSPLMRGSLQISHLGSTLSTLKLAAGDHKIKLEKPGFKTWERTLTVAAGTIATVNPTMEKVD